MAIQQSPDTYDGSLGCQLDMIERGIEESRADYLGRLAVIADSCAEETIVPNDEAYFRYIIPEWQIEFPYLRGSRFGFAKRDLPGKKALPDLDQYSAPGRLIGIKKNHIIMLARTTFRGQDLAAIFRLEAHFKADQPMPTKMIEITTGPEVQPASVLNLSNRENEFLHLSTKTPKVIAQELGINESTARTFLLSAKKKNNMNLEELIRAAYAEELIDISGLPREYAPLTSREQEVLTYMLKPYCVSARAMDRSVCTIRTHRHNIYKKLGVDSKIAAFVIGLRDGLLRDDLLFEA